MDLDQTHCNFNFPLADPFFYQSSSIDMLIGADLYPDIVLEGVKKNVLNSLLAQNTVFGWVLLGPYDDISIISNFSTFVSYSDEPPPSHCIERFWKIEELSQIYLLSPSDQYCEDLYRSTTFRDATGRYIVKLPFKNPTEEPQLGTSRFNAMKQYLRNEKGLKSKPIVKTEYDRVLSEYIELGHMSSTPPYELWNDGCVQSFYMPHHAIFKPQSITTKLRVVFNASCSSSNGNSLNDLLYPGPVLQSDITLLLLNWRFYRYVFNGDIEKMYRQIGIDPDHAQYQRILFRPNGDQKVVDYNLNTVTFGVNCAPYLAIRTLHQLSSDVENSFPLDILSARRAQTELITALRSAGFYLRKWAANDSELLNHIPREDLLNKDFLTIKDDSSTKTLGVQWNASTDTFSFSTNPQSLSVVSTTKRDVLSAISRLYDPAGWLAPVVVTAKIIIQQIWKDGTEWKQNLKALTHQKWKSFISDFSEIEKITIPRWVDYSPWKKMQLHGFSDASEKAYAATVYVRVRHDSSLESHSLWAKSKFAPVNTLSLPRLELQGAYLLSRMIRILLNQFDFLNNIPIHLWTDSTIVLAWLSKPPSTWKTFVANRTSEIITNVPDVQWSHVPSADNPADLASRGISPGELKSNQLWWTGPNWLQEPKLS
ncbi:uncharacterized protein LOC129921489 [Episyrphus balteatus]|uniref:uncharacterized protein LOC129921489 n=1 Tax=Episyrphus balteatus TaxID=286459 RepID=UPI0024860C3D|nr:uncharacterized protein LOC129921489 [Episyrphus balteatus]